MDNSIVFLVFNLLIAVGNIILFWLAVKQRNAMVEQERSFRKWWDANRTINLGGLTQSKPEPKPVSSYPSIVEIGKAPVPPPPPLPPEYTDTGKKPAPKPEVRGGGSLWHDQMKEK